MKLNLFIFLCHFVLISGEILFKCEKFDRLDGDSCSCSFASECSPREFDDYLANLTVLSCKFKDEKNETQESLIDLKEITKIVIENVAFVEFPERLFGKFPFLKNLQITADIKSLKISDFINASHLEELDLSNNQINALESEQFKHLVCIKTIVLAYNTITAVDKSNFIGIGGNLTHIDLSHNKLSSFSEDFIAAMINNQDSITINLSFNQISQFRTSNQDFSSNSTDITIKLDFNNLSELQMKNKISGISINKNRLTDIEVKATNIIAENNQMTDFYISEISEVVTVDNNLIRSLKWDKNLEKLIELDLSGNGMLLSETRDLFTAMPNLRILDLSNNDIDSLDLTESLKMVTKLRHLSLKSIKLDHITQNTFKNLINLETLIISHNPLYHFDLKYFETLKNLEILRIDSTYISYLKDYPKTKEILPNLLRISLHGNVIPCKTLAQMFDFFILNNIEVIDPENPENIHQNVKGIRCTDPTHEIEPIVNGHDADEIAYKFEEMMAHIKVIEEKQNAQQGGITMTQLIISNCISIALSFSFLVTVLCVANYLRNNRYRKFINHTIDSLDVEIQSNEL